MKGFVTMETLTLSILPMLWQVCLLLFFSFLAPRSVGLPASSFPFTLLSLSAAVLSWQNDMYNSQGGSYKRCY